MLSSRISKSVVKNLSVSRSARIIPSLLSCSVPTFQLRNFSVPPENVEQKFNNIVEKVTKEVTILTKKMEQTYGTQNPALLSQSSVQNNLLSVTIKSITFFTQVLNSLEPKVATSYIAKLSMYPQTDFGMLLAITKGVKDSPLHLVDRLKALVGHSKDEYFINIVRKIDRVPIENVLNWDIPFKNPELVEIWEDQNRTPFPFELTLCYVDPAAKLSFNDYLMLVSSAHLDALWGAFYATGDKNYVKRVVDIAENFSTVLSAHPSAAMYMSSLEDNLPEEYLKTDTPEDVMKSVSAHTSRLANWSLIRNAFAHSIVTATLADILSEVSPILGAKLSGVDTKKVIPYSPASIEAKLDIIPPLLMFIVSFHKESLKSSATSN